ncbi:M23 family metallopeptidase [Malaciobacter mytili]|uniref:Peptidase M24 n=1 Tax=Malaciobacter mytili LMG 24559 TaxID=1032238 RepID=A0AAX2AHW3_9BACT|nr:peptidoglycan DD-metalloendopeptidase family protein [Malaciobacter mytili]AXH15649.1 zinc metallopeptidase, M23 family [Malaciobacter mytili LMG 24559]RXI41574.1 peptidase M24 [Malaciobacter mytili]RXK16165.1 peptidase M24 [Malaciobacter mytili LMG 24559]
MKIILILIIFISSMFALQVQELTWPKGDSFLTFLDKYNISQKLYFELEKEDKELCSEIVAGTEYNLLLNEDGTLKQVLIPVSEDMQLHIYESNKGEYKFEAIPISYQEIEETIAIEIKKSPFQDIFEATENLALANEVMRVYGRSINFRRIQKGDFVALKYKQKIRMGKYFGSPELTAAMVEVNGKKHYRFKNNKNDKYYDEKGRGFSKTYFFKIPLSYNRISSQFTKRRWHPVLKKYRAHLGTDFAAPKGRPIYAAGDGKIIFRGVKGGYGNVIIIDHKNGYRTLYAHQSRFKSGLKVGSYVSKGTHIGYVGNTGLSSGPHLHLGLYKNGRAIDPLQVIKRGKEIKLSGKEQATFIANTKDYFNELNLVVSDENRKLPTRLARKESFTTIQ